jgi:hypothetical protein
MDPSDNNNNNKKPLALFVSPSEGGIPPSLILFRCRSYCVFPLLLGFLVLGFSYCYLLGVDLRWLGLIRHACTPSDTSLACFGPYRRHQLCGWSSRRRGLALPHRRSSYGWPPRAIAARVADRVS